jgi:hypothetical protein
VQWGSGVPLIRRARREAPCKGIQRSGAGDLLISDGQFRNVVSGAYECRGLVACSAGRPCSVWVKLAAFFTPG